VRGRGTFPLIGAGRNRFCATGATALAKFRAAQPYSALFGPWSSAARPCRRDQRLAAVAALERDRLRQSSSCFVGTDAADATAESWPHVSAAKSPEAAASSLKWGPMRPAPGKGASNRLQRRHQRCRAAPRRIRAIDLFGRLDDMDAGERRRERRPVRSQATAERRNHPRAIGRYVKRFAPAGRREPGLAQEMRDLRT